VLLALCLGGTPAQDAPADMAKMMQSAKRFTEPGERHKALERFVGKWDTEMRVFMGAQATPAEKGTASFAWRMEGRWLESEWQGSMMGMPISGALWLGYDNFKQSYVCTGISSADTAMNRVEGDMTQDGTSLVLYGTIDEYLTGEHDKLTKQAWRFLSPDKLLLEVHDFGIGEQNSKVIEVSYTRVK
jgi:hypothetical protein